MLLLAAIALATIPFPFVGRATGTLLGLPTWLWASGLATLALSIATAVGIQRYWKDDDPD